MIIYNNHEINSIYYKDHQIQQAFYGKKLVFDYNNYKSNIKYKNYLLDPIKYRDYIDNFYISSNTGEIQNQNGYKSSNFIEITPNSSIYFMNQSTELTLIMQVPYMMKIKILLKE